MNEAKRAYEVMSPHQIPIDFMDSSLNHAGSILVNNMNPCECS